MIKYVTIKNVAEKLGICRASVYNYVQQVSGFPQPVKIGRLTRFNDEEIDVFMKNKAPRGVNGECK